MIIVCVAPMIILNPILALTVLAAPPGTPSLLLAGALLIHTDACSGDMAFAGYFWSRRRQPLFTYDDATKSLTFVYLAKGQDNP